MTDRSLTFASGPHRLVGTVTRPLRDGAVPAVLIVGGSGPLDRDGNHKRARLDISRQIATALRDAGLASLRYDKRGVGDSDGSFLATGMHDNADDVRAALTALREQPGTDLDRVFLLGHSEGAILATAVLASGSSAAGAILLSPTARPGSGVLRWQAEKVAADLPTPVRTLLRLFRVDLTAKIARNHARLMATTEDVARLGGVRVNARWFREFMTYDPTGDLTRLTIPTLAVAGGKDLQAPPQDLHTIAALLGDRVETLLIDDLSHILRSQPATPTMRTYRRDLTRPVDRRVLTAVIDWIHRH
ncbi:alpha/beta fold hydrolase [Actinoplanes sp. NEAU-A12]|uniref:Alpha/beta fold hydrolase n=1 Tax=Actinoplanes sandaracinus TaxID=3045177 RepID=A0ABT6WQ53_9ACTN|nr:alpha/beta fold hydrolase [Actinoplanes sandaracinus]MDI6101865.1 alpha/beta fold hydrolase [Actinoplanes sandaracinus]